MVRRQLSVFRHAIQLFDSSDSIAATIADFAASGLKANQTVAVFARTEHWRRVQLNLQNTGVRFDSAITEGRLLVFDAAETLRQLFRHSAPDARRFNALVGELVQSPRQQRDIRIYGEMVDVLADDREFGGALKLEGWWNALGQQFKFSVLHGYMSMHFGSESTRSTFERIYSCHSAHHAHSHDVLGAWLMTKGRSAARS